MTRDALTGQPQRLVDELVRIRHDLEHYLTGLVVEHATEADIDRSLEHLVDGLGRLRALVPDGLMHMRAQHLDLDLAPPVPIEALIGTAEPDDAQVIDLADRRPDKKAPQQ